MGQAAGSAVGELADLVDQMVDLRRIRARRHGYDTPLRETLARCTISEDEAESFLGAYLRQAVGGHERLTSGIRAATGCTDDPMNHFAYYLRGLTAGTELPLLPLQGCLDVASSVTETVFGCTLRPEDGGSRHVITLSARSGGRRVGTIQVDLLGIGDDKDGPRGTPAARPDASRADDPVLPVGHVLCRYQLGRGGERLVSFDSAHSILHEFGHAFTQVIIDPRRPGLSGLEYLPVERLEDLSLWFEKWVYHPELTARVAPSADATRGLEMSQRVKMLEFLSTHLQRSVVAALDFDMHRRADGGIRDSFRRLDDEFGIAQYCDLGDHLWPFTWPMYRSNPGAGLVYLWGSAYGAQHFAPFLGLGLADIPSAGAFTDVFGSCFDPNLTSERPDIGAVLRFYDSGLAGARIR